MWLPSFYLPKNMEHESLFIVRGETNFNASETQNQAYNSVQDLMKFWYGEDRYNFELKNVNILWVNKQIKKVCHSILCTQINSPWRGDI